MYKPPQAALYNLIPCARRLKEGMKKTLVAGIGIFLLLTLLAVIAIPRRASEKRIYADDIAMYLQDGDIICRLGDRLWSTYFKDISPIDKRFSHLGIIRIVDGALTVINAEGRAIEGKDHVNETPLEEFLTIAKAVGIYRLHDCEGKAVSSGAMEYIGYPFDWNFDLHDENKLYCTELLYVVMKKIAPEIQLQTLFQKELSREIIPLEAVSNSDYFREVVYVKEKGGINTLYQTKKEEQKRSVFTGFFLLYLQ
jgi:hypothetical protein